MNWPERNKDGSTVVPRDQAKTSAFSSIPNSNILNITFVVNSEQDLKCSLGKCNTLRTKKIRTDREEVNKQ